MKIMKQRPFYSKYNPKDNCKQQPKGNRAQSYKTLRQVKDGRHLSIGLNIPMPNKQYNIKFNVNFDITFFISIFKTIAYFLTVLMT